jgi:redox-regulated HSP33 family molecular chaperone
MAFSDPQALKSGVTYTFSGGTALSLPRTSTNDNKSSYTTSDGNTKLTVSHAYSPNRTRRTVRNDFQKIATNPLDSTKNALFTGSAYLVLDMPVAGFTAAELQAQIEMIAYWLLQTGTLAKFVGGEN